jgi:hypothetical protein
MASEQLKEHRPAHGKAPREWEEELRNALDRRDHAQLKQALKALGGELGSESQLLNQIGRAPLLDRLVEQARRLLHSAPTGEEALEKELTRERQLWADYRQRYRKCFVPAELRPFLNSSALFVSPSTMGVQYDGFEKYSGHSRGTPREAITLFYNATTDEATQDSATTPANVFTSFDEQSGRFVVQRVYRTDLPRNAGRDCILEHISLLIPGITDLRELVFDNVQNRKTYDAHVITDRNGVFRLRQNVALDHTPLGRFGLRILTSLSLKVASILPVLDGFGFLDLHLIVESKSQHT